MISTVSQAIEAAFRAIPLANIRAATLVDFDLYIMDQARSHQSPGACSRPDRCVLYHRKDLPITEDHLLRLTQSGVHTLYVRQEDGKKYTRYLETNLRIILVDETCDTSEKAGVIYETASGLVEDVFQNPSSPDSLNRSETLVNNTISYLVKEKNSVNHFLSTMIADYTTYTHSVHVCVYSLALAKRLGMGATVLHDLGLGALLHDVGKMKVDARILQKRGPLSADEWRVVKLHPDLGVRMLRGSTELPETVYSIVHQHHEKCNGTGYPRRLRGYDIHPFARIVCLVDVFDALTTNRPYKLAMSSHDALKLMRDEMDGCFEPDKWRELVLLVGERGRA